MAPLIAGLLKAGLSMAANAALAKGKQYLEEKAGVSLDMQAEPTQEQLVALKQAEMQHEAEMARIRQDDDRLTLDFFKAEVEDRDSARKREADIAKAFEAPMLNKVITPILALIVTVGGGYMLATETETSVQMAVVGIMSSVLAYYFGTSASSARNGDAIRAIAAKGAQ